MTHCRQTSRRQIIGVNVIGKDIVRLDQRRQAFLQALDGQTLRRVNSRRAQDRNPDARPGAPLTQTMLGINPPSGARAFRIEPPRLINLRAATIAVNARRAYVNKLTW